ncbi:MAG: hypothetical protein ABIQ09_10110 [Jatrophihabitantaceae bacterium]
MARSPRYAPQHRRLSRLGAIGAALAAVLLLSGCFAIGVKARVHADDTVSGTARFGVSKSLAALTGGTSMGLFGQAGEPCRFGNRSFASKQFDDGAYTGVECSFDRLSLADFNAGMQGPRLEHVGERFRLSGSFDLASALREQAGQPSGSASGTAAPPSALPTDLASLLPSDLASLLPSDLASLLPSDLASLLPSDLASLLPSDLAGLLPSGVPTDLSSLLPSGGPTDLSSLLPSGLPQLDPSAILKTAKVSFEFSFPGRIISSKGQARGNTVTFTPDAAGRIEFETVAEAEPSDGAGIGPAGWVGLAALLAAVAVLAGWLLRRRSRPVAAAGYPGPAPYGPPAPYGTPAQQGPPAQDGLPGSNPLPGFGPFYGPEDGQPQPEDPRWRPPGEPPS